MDQYKWINGKKYYFHKIVYNYKEIKKLKRKYKGIRYYYDKFYNKKTHKTGYIIYLDRKIIWNKK